MGWGPISSLVLNGNVGIGTTSPAGKLEVVGAASIHDGTGYSMKTARMASGSLTIGSTTRSYGGGNSWTSNTAGLLLETLSNTEIAVHDSGHRIASLLYYEGDSTNRITIGRDMEWGEISTISLRGNVGIGTLSPSARLDVNGTLKTDKLQLGGKWLLSGDGDASANDDWLRLYGPSSGTYYGGLAVGRLWVSSGTLQGSDSRLKKGIGRLEQCLDKVTALTGVSYRWRDPELPQGQHMGLVAEEVEKVFPDLVSEGPNGMKALDYTGLIAPLIEAVKEQQAQIAQLTRMLQEVQVPER